MVKANRHTSLSSYCYVFCLALLCVLLVVVVAVVVLLLLLLLFSVLLPWRCCPLLVGAAAQLLLVGYFCGRSSLVSELAPSLVGCMPES